MMNDEWPQKAQFVTVPSIIGDDIDIKIIIFKERFDLKPISHFGALALRCEVFSMRLKHFARRVRLKMPPFLKLFFLKSIAIT